MNCITQAREMLALHRGACSVIAESHIGHAFMLLKASGDVKINNSNTPGYIDVYSIDFEPNKDRTDE